MNTQFPAIYDFPPLYTRQPNSLIREQQLDTWVDVLLQYAKANRIWLMASDGHPLDPRGEQSIFVNFKLDRQVQGPFTQEIWSHALRKGVVLKDANDSYFILWKSLESWSSLMLQWFETCGKLNQVVTIYEIVSGDDSSTWEFHGMNERVCELALGKLVERGRATLIRKDAKVVAVKIV
ncbi:HDL311Wp [Eremothecium sinecaudum]|uniref:HDL311Wp n=1 Tax=Eremothecium sinecaudum TaxID=45286 RepID=A0A109UZK2_9SACH|nr:HDL311Wp [Eremothecium sinecaudum]AMD20433.1 HDL311Wp [Eremothecium sinecaudum]